MTQIDIVLPFVDGAAPGYEELSRCHTGEFVPCQLRSLGELRFTLRSIATHAPWANVILVVQDRTHVPDWIDASRLRIVSHDAFIPAPLLPTFHAATISAHLHLVPDLADRYLIWEDDTLVTRPFAPSLFFKADGGARYAAQPWPILPGLERFLGTYQRNLTESRALVHRITGARPSCFLYPHMPLPVFKQHWREFFQLFSKDGVFRNTVTRKSRGDEIGNPTIDPLVTYPNWVEIVKDGRSSLHRSGRALRTLAHELIARHRTGTRLFGSYPVVNDMRRMGKNMQALLDERPLFANVNDDAYDDWAGGSENLNPESHRLLTETLQTLFPEPSPFEL